MVARVEIPRWLAEPEIIGQIHTSIVLDCVRLNYPVALAMAHNKITLRASFEKLLKEKTFATFLEHGGKFRESAKNKVKGVYVGQKTAGMRGTCRQRTVFTVLNIEWL